MKFSSKGIAGISRVSVFIFFFLSGVCGLIYEVVWHKQIGHVMGHTVYAITTVLAAFMGGLAIGSYLAGRYIDRLTKRLNKHAPLLVYAILEGLIGLYCLLLPLFLHWFTPLLKYIYNNYQTSFYTFSLLRFAIGAILLVIPTAMMGATLPILAKFLTRTMSDFGGTLSRVYAVNTFGATLGAFLAGFILIPDFGVGTTVWIAAGANFAICFLSLGLYYINVRADAKEKAAPEQFAQEPAPQVEAASKNDDDTRYLKLVFWAIGISGFISFIYQTAWTKVMALVIGNSTYSFSVILTSFILGIGIGSWIVGRYIDRIKDLMRLFAITEIGIGIAGFFIILILGRLSYMMVPVFLNYSDWYREFMGYFSPKAPLLQDENVYTFLRLIHFGIITMILIIPTTLIGATFPIVAKICAQKKDDVGKIVGKVYAYNTIGAILGAFFAGFVFIEYFGLQNSLRIAVVLNLAIGMVLLFAKTLRSLNDRALAVSILVVFSVLIFIIAPWHMQTLDSGVYNPTETRGNFGPDTTAEDFYYGAEDMKNLLYYKEGSAAVVSVWQHEDNTSLRVNGKTDASTIYDTPTQMMVAHLPILLHDTQGDITDDKILVIGLGSGMTAGGAASHPVSKIDVAELCPEVVEASRYFGEKYNNNVLADKRVTLMIEDGRNHITLTDKKYDVIISEPTNPWIAGVANLFTKEFFELCRDRLEENGMFCQWVQAYHMSMEDFKMIIRTFRTVFPNATLWEPYQSSSDYFLIGTKGDFALNFNELERRLKSPNVARDIEFIKFTMSRAEIIDALDDETADVVRGMRWGSAIGLLQCFVMGGEYLEMFANNARSKFINTDNHNRLEFSAPKHIYSKSVYVNEYEFFNYMHNPLYLLDNPAAKNNLPLSIRQMLQMLLIKKRTHLAPEFKPDDSDFYEDEDEDEDEE